MFEVLASVASVILTLLFATPWEVLILTCQLKRKKRVVGLACFEVLPRREADNKQNKRLTFGRYILEPADLDSK